MALAAFFLALDAARGDPTRTLEELAAAVFGLSPGTLGGVHLVGMLGLQLAVCGLVGVGAAGVFRIARVPENALLGGGYGLLAFSFVFYLASLLSEARLTDATPWPLVLLANLLAGVVMGWYLQRVGTMSGHPGAARLVRSHPVLREGGLAGLLGAVVVGVWFLLVDVVTAQAFHTPAVLGSILFLEAEGLEAVARAPDLIVGYTAIHVLTFLLLGVVLAGLASAIALVFVFLGVAFVAVVVVLGTWILEEVLLAVLVGNALATVVMGAYVWHAHPRLRAEIRIGGLWEDL